MTLNFHPDRLLADGRMVVEALLEVGRYKNQFETGLSNGSRTAFAGGARDGWEETLFGGAYHEPVAEASERPKYGALDVMHHADGGSPRFGSCYVVLRAHVNARCTFTWGDSHLGPADVGVADAFDSILAAMLESADVTGGVLAARLTVPELVERVSRAAAVGPVGRALDDYIEAQVHGTIELSRDVEALVVDPAFEGTEVGARLRELCERHAIEHRVHPGFELLVSEVPGDFRGPRMPAFAARAASVSSGPTSHPVMLDASIIGRAAQSLHRDPSVWEDWDTPEETLQHVKQLWHVLVRYGAPPPPPPQAEASG
ncbi:MAG: hypothetical protein JWO86_3753 [Myxococcaceae bacterium]|nr:hypothetical protein [Myxococcaceae bacterium]